MTKLFSTLEVAKQLGIETVSVRARVHRLRKRGKDIGRLAHSGRHGGSEMVFSAKEVSLLKQNGLGGEQPNQWTAKATKKKATAKGGKKKAATKKSRRK